MADHNQNDKRPNRYIKRNSFAVGALLSGILGILNLCCFAFTTAIIFGVGAICFAIISKKDQKLTKSARVAVILGTSAILCGVAEFFYALEIIETLKDPANIAEFNQMFQEFENFLEGHTVIGKTVTH